MEHFTTEICEENDAASSVPCSSTFRDRICPEVDEDFDEINEGDSTSSANSELIAINLSSFFMHLRTITISCFFLYSI